MSEGSELIPTVAERPQKVAEEPMETIGCCMEQRANNVAGEKQSNRDGPLESENTRLQRIGESTQVNYFVEE